jgi:hypothetical protein
MKRKKEKRIVQRSKNIYYMNSANHALSNIRAENQAEYMELISNHSRIEDQEEFRAVANNGDANLIIS